MKTIFTTLALLVIVLTSSAQSTLLKLKFEEAEQAYNEGRYDQTLSNLSELESEGLNNPRILHLKILAKSKVIQNDISETSFNELKQLINFYLENYDIEGLEEKYKEVYEVSKNLKTVESCVVKNKADEFFKNKEFDKALALYLQSYEMGYGELDLYLSVLEIYKEISKTSDVYKAEVIKWKEKAADLGHIPSCIDMGHLYREGKEVPKDPVKAAQYYRKAEGSNLPGANYGMGWLYLFGVDGEYDFNKAQEMFFLEPANSKFYYESILLRDHWGYSFALNEYFNLYQDGPTTNHKDYYHKERLGLKYCISKSNKLLVEEIINTLKIGAEEFNSPMAQLYLHNLYDGKFNNLSFKKNRELAEKYLIYYNNNPQRNDDPYIHFLIAYDYQMLGLRIGLNGAPSKDLKEIYNKYDIALKSGSFEATQRMKLEAREGSSYAISVLNKNNISY